MRALKKRLADTVRRLQWLIIQGLRDGADFAPLGAVIVAPRFDEEPQQPHPAGCRSLA